MIAEIIGPSGRVHYRRPVDDPLVEEAKQTPGYSVRIVEKETIEPPKENLMNEAICKGSWWLGSACGRCESCYDEARKCLPPLIKQAKAMRETLLGIHEELTQHGRLVSNPKLTARAIGAVVEPES